MKTVDPERSWSEVERRIDSESDPVLVANLTRVRDHMQAELRMQLPRVMVTLVDDPIYRFFGFPGFDTLRGRAEVAAYYAAMFEAGRMDAEFAIERIAVDPASVVTEGTMMSTSAGSALIESGISSVDSKPVQSRHSYLVLTPLLVMWPIAESGLIVGEHIYLGRARHELLPDETRKMF